MFTKVYQKTPLISRWKRENIIGRLSCTMIHETAFVTLWAIAEGTAGAVAAELVGVSS